MRNRIGKMLTFMLKGAAVVLLVAFCTAVILYYKDASGRLKRWDADKARQAEFSIPVRLAQVTSEVFKQDVGGTCVTKPFREIPIYAASQIATSDRNLPLTSMVDEVLVQEGECIEAGQVIATLQSELLESNLRERTTLLKLTEQRFLRMKDAVEKKAARDYELDKLESELAKLRLSVVEIESQLAGTELRSPIGGIITNLEIANGMVLSNVQRPVAVVCQIDPLLVEMDYPIALINQLALGQTAELTIDGFPGETFSGTVIRIAPEANESSRVLPVVIELDNPDGRVKGGLPGFAKIQRTVEGVRIPATALNRSGNEYFVFCSVNQTVRMQKVSPGSQIPGGYIVIEKGLQSGDQVVVAGQHAVSEGDVVNPDWQAWANRHSDSENSNNLSRTVRYEALSEERR